VHYVLIGTHSPEICPTSNSKTREMLLQTAPQIPTIAANAGVKIVAGPYVNREHTTVTVVEAANGESVDRFLVESRLAQWNVVRIIPSLSMEEGMADIQAQSPIF
jgi:hypothetical protein